jgi:exodeoxyribonuclease X
MTIIRVVDFETTGMEPPAEVCEVGICELVLEGLSVADNYKSWLCGVTSMPPEVRAVHHITLAECADKPPFNPDDLTGAIDAYAAHNSEFETKFWTPDKPIICTYKAALRVWPDAPSHSNGALRYWLEDQGLIHPDHAMTQPAHRAGSDAYTTAHILAALFATGATGKQMVGWTREPRLFPTCPLGDWKGKPWADVDIGFLKWVVGKHGMESDYKWNAQREIDRRAAA